MTIQVGADKFWTTFVEDGSAGFAGFRLHRERSGKSAEVGQVTFWDANGQFVFETCGTEVPVEVVEAAIAEARDKLLVK
jgi:hypothetical protein